MLKYNTSGKGPQNSLDLKKLHKWLENNGSLKNVFPKLKYRKTPHKAQWAGLKVNDIIGQKSFQNFSWHEHEAVLYFHKRLSE